MTTWAQDAPLKVYVTNEFSVTVHYLFNDYAQSAARRESVGMATARRLHIGEGSE